MPRATSIPQDDDKIGKKIDYVAKQLGQSLASHGYVRKGRDCVATVGDGPGMSWNIINLQGNKWNEGAYGAFFVNLSVQFPAVCREVSKIQSHEWIGEWAEKPHEASGQYRERLEGVMPSNLFSRFFASNGQVAASLIKHREVRIEGGIPLDTISMQLTDAVVSYALPWFQLRSGLREMCNGTHTAFIGPTPVDKIAAAMLTNDREALQRVIAERGQKLPLARVGAIRKWITDGGFDAAGIPDSPSRQQPSDQ